MLMSANCTNAWFLSFPTAVMIWVTGPYGAHTPLISASVVCSGRLRMWSTCEEYPAEDAEFSKARRPKQRHRHTALRENGRYHEFFRLFLGQGTQPEQKIHASVQSTS